MWIFKGFYFWKPKIWTLESWGYLFLKTHFFKLIISPYFVANKRVHYCSIIMFSNQCKDYWQNNEMQKSMKYRPHQGHREFPFWKRKIPPPKKKIPENSRSVKCLILHALTQLALKLATFIWINYNDMVSSPERNIMQCERLEFLHPAQH